MGQPKEINSRLADIKPRLGSRSLYNVAQEPDDKPSQPSDKIVSSNINDINVLPPKTDNTVLIDTPAPIAADLPPQPHSKKKGRKPKYGTNLTEPITVNFTPEEKAKLEARSAQLLGAPLTAIIRDALHEKGLI
ncbi:MAG: hypothetical protein M0036_19215 [Desulfobacteraceae bacterium]|nr:hypothetical protein [Desulfobacteraceae bacterium]